MNAHQPAPSDDEWLRADQPGPPLTALLRQRRGVLLGALALALALAVALLAIAGDCSGFECRSQTWSWDGDAWRQRRPAQEPDFAFHSMALVPDPISGRLLLVTTTSNSLGPAPMQTWRWEGRDWVVLQLIGHPGADLKIVGATGDHGAVFAFEDVSRDFNTPRLNAWEWTGNAWRTIAP